jgi:hypothetical protein
MANSKAAQASQALSIMALLGHVSTENRESLRQYSNVSPQKSLRCEENKT